MKYAKMILLLPLIGGATITLAQQGGTIRTMPQGFYECALPGDAAGQPWVPVEGAHFTIDNASSYITENGRGTYLLTGKNLTFTRGPLKGQKFHRISENALRPIAPDGSLGRMRCVRTAK